MPYDNKYNRALGENVRQVNQKHIDRQSAANDDAPANDPVTSQVESMVLKNPDIVGGNGYAAATLGDFGYEPTLGAVGEGKPKRARKKKGEGAAAAGMGAGLAAAGRAAAGVSGGKKAKQGGRRRSANCARHRQNARATSLGGGRQNNGPSETLQCGNYGIGTRSRCWSQRRQQEETQRPGEGNNEKQGAVSARGQQTYKSE